MKILKTIAVCISLILISCDVTDSGDNTNMDPAMSLSVGNKYMYSHSSSNDNSSNSI